MDKQKIDEMLMLLSREFGIPKFDLKIQPNGKNGFCNYVKKQIVIGLKALVGVENLVIHEFAHSLCCTRYGRIKRMTFTGRWIEEHHGREFVRCLIEVIDAWHGDQTEYNWANEYKSLRAYGPRKKKEVVK